jgi:hypothetical protein
MILVTSCYARLRCSTSALLACGTSRSDLSSTTMLLNLDCLADEFGHTLSCGQARDFVQQSGPSCTKLQIE